MVVALPAAGQEIHEDIKVVAEDAAGGDWFSHSVALSGTTAIVGADGNDDAGFWSGSAYLIDITTGQQLFKLTANDAAARDQFGFSVAISGTRAIVGAFLDDDGGSQSGSAYLFDSITGEQLFKLTADDAAAEDWFGRSVAISGRTAIIGSYKDDDGGSESGSAYLFDTITGEQLFKLTASDAAADNQFGKSVAISGTIAIVGSLGNDDAHLDSGAAYLFDTTTGQQLFKLVKTDVEPDDSFGSGVAISGSRAIVLGSGDNGVGFGVFSTWAFVFDTITGEQLLKFNGTNDLLTSPVAMSGERAIMGRGDGFSDIIFFSGSAAVFDITNGQQVALLRASDAMIQDNLGRSVAISGTRIIVGTNFTDDAGSDSGSAYVFSLCQADLNGDGVQDFSDVAAYLDAYSAMDSVADFTGDGRFNFFDISAFLRAFYDGCL